MKVWIGGEVGLDDNDFESYRIISNQIEKSLNAYLEEIGYKNDALEKLRVITILRDDDTFNEIKKLNKRKKNTDIRLKIDYDSFKNGDEHKRKKLIYEMLLRAMNFLKEEKKLEGFNPIEAYINKQIQSLDKQE